jgi:hypothetical protein
MTGIICMKKNRIMYGFVSLFLLVVGMFVYLLFRDLKNILLFNCIPKPELTETLFMQLTPSILSDLLRYNLPDMLWFVSGILVFRFIWFYKLKKQMIYIFCFYVMGFVFEICQLSEKVPGTFDFLDIIFMGIGAFFEGLLYKNFIRRRLG